MSFQGYLTDTLGTSLDGPQTISVKLFDAETSGLQVWAREYPGTDVNAGVFDVVLENGSPEFRRLFLTDSLWVEIAVGSEVLIPRSQLRASPFAMGLSLPVHAEAHVQPPYTSTRIAFKITNTAISDENYGVWGESVGVRGTGVYGYATAPLGNTFGVYGKSESQVGVGVQGRASAKFGLTVGVKGQTYSTDGIGVFGGAYATSGRTMAVWGENSSSSGRGVFGYASADSGSTYGVVGTSDSPTGRGVYGIVPAATGVSTGVYGESRSDSGRGVYGFARSASGSTYGVMGKSDSPTGRGVYGTVPAATGVSTGVYGESGSDSGRGVYGKAYATSGTNFGVLGESGSTDGRGVYGLAYSASGRTFGVYGESESQVGVGVQGRASAKSGLTVGVKGLSYSTDGTGVFGGAYATSGATTAVWGENSSSSGRGVYGRATANSGSTYGVMGRSDSPTGRGVYGAAYSTSGTNYGVRGETSSATGWAGYFSGGYGTFTRGATNLGADLMLGGHSVANDDGRIYSDVSYPSSDIFIFSNDAVVFKLDSDGDGEQADFVINQKDDVTLLRVEETGRFTLKNAANANTFQVREDGSVWVLNGLTHGSDRNRKDAIVPVDVGDILEAVARLPISEWRYKGLTASHVGPMAQDFYASFGLGDDDTGIATVDGDGIALAAIQGLYKLVREQGKMIAVQQAEIERLLQIVESGP